ncbi:MAG: hypothetical protein AAFQ53_15230, partial [Bacteroidota bacterium]
KGVIQATGRLEKALQGSSAKLDGYLWVLTGRATERLRGYVAALRKHVRGIEANTDFQVTARELEHPNRLLRMGLTTPERLRAALRAYMGVRGELDEPDATTEAERDLIRVKVPGFFPTPPRIVKQMLDRAGIEDGDLVLEPSAGKGDIADAIRSAHPGATLHVVEQLSTLRDILQKKGHELVGRDFLDYAPGSVYDVVVMNPPFGRRKDAVHVRHAYGMLKPGGVLVAVMSRGTFFRKQEKPFRDWLEGKDPDTIQLPDDAFKSSFRPTSVRTSLLVLEKPSSTSEPPKPQAGFVLHWNGFKAKLDGKAWHLDGAWFVTAELQEGPKEGQTVYLARDSYPGATDVIEQSEERAEKSRVWVAKAEARKSIKTEQQAENALETGKVYSAFIHTLHTDPARFQPRGQAFSVESALRVAREFDPNLMEPVVVWRDEAKGKDYVLAGHSRLQGFRWRRDGNASYGIEPDTSVQRIPVRYFDGDEEEAIRFAAVENDKGTSLTNLERAGYLRTLRGAGESESAIKEESSKLYKRNGSTVYALSFLNPAGKAATTLHQFQGNATGEARDAETMAVWVGKLRARYVSVGFTDQHEREVYDLLLANYKTRGRRFSSYNAFLDYVRGFLESRMMMGQLEAGPINFGQASTKSPQERAVDEEVRRAER